MKSAASTNRVRGVFLLDAVYGELDKFASWIENNRSGFFVSSYTRYTKRHDQELMRDAAGKGITFTENMDGPLRPGSVVFVQTPDGITHRDYVTQAWTEHPVKEVLVKMAAAPVADADRRRPLLRAPLAEIRTADPAALMPRGSVTPARKGPPLVISRRCRARRR